ncbi:MAG: hypothetical protein KKD08_06000, partial [Alphaproteobacteria bacterium]|nr:hypothetical protein [Alphaproteobacteria bacterium]
RHPRERRGSGMSRQEMDEREKLAREINPEAFVPMEDIIGMRLAYAEADRRLATQQKDRSNGAR